MSRTKVIAFEGIDGSGKTVQINLVKQRLEDMGYSVALKSFPEYGSFFGKEVGDLLSNACGVSAADVDGRSMALWFALDRWESFKDYCDGETDILLINRYVLSNAVYQSIRDRDLGKPDLLEWVFELEFGHFKLPMPDVNIVMDVEPEDAGQNVDKKGFRSYVGESRDVYEAADGIQARARRKYIEYSSRRSDIEIVRCMAQNGMRGMQDIAADVVEVLKKRNII